MARPSKPKPRKKMPPKARAAFELYLGLGPTRKLQQVADMIDKSYSHVKNWSRKHNWVELCSEHDYANLRDSLGQREVQKEAALQTMIDRCGEAADVLYEIMTDRRTVPILDRHGEPVTNPETGETMVKPLVKASTRAQCAEKILGIGGLVPVKRTENIDRTAESLDAAATVIQALSPKQLEQLQGILATDD